MSQLTPLQTTVQDLCSAALLECGAVGLGQTASAQDITDAWARFQWMLQEWGEDPFLVWREHTITVQQIDTSLLPTDPNQGTASQPVYYLPIGPGAGRYGGFETGDNVGGVGGFGVIVPGNGGTPGTYITSLLGGTGQGVNASVVVGVGGGVTSVTLTSPGAGSGYSIGDVLTATLPPLVGFSVPVVTLAPPLVAKSVSPRRLKSVFLRQPSSGGGLPIDYPLEALEAMEDYSRIALKGMVSFPGAYYYDPAYPLGRIFLYPLPSDSVYGVGAVLRDQLPIQFATAADVIFLPPVYFNAFMLNLAVRLRPHYGIREQPGDHLTKLAAGALRAIRSSMTQIAQLSLPGELSRPGIYNIFSDRTY